MILGTVSFANLLSAYQKELETTPGSHGAQVLNSQRSAGEIIAISCASSIDPRSARTFLTPIFAKPSSEHARRASMLGMLKRSLSCCIVP